LVCDHTSRRSLISTLFFVGTFGVLFNGIMSDSLGRQRTIYIFAISNAAIHILIALFLNTNWLNAEMQQIVYMILRLISGTTSYTYTAAVVLTIELCGPSKRVAAVNTIYYFYISGEFLVVLLAYFLRDYKYFLIANAIFLSTFVFYFW
jgi:OCT family organic cation transporter-like MFS transporter 4/5